MHNLGQPADLLLAHSFEFDGKKDPTGMLMSEKREPFGMRDGSKYSTVTECVKHSR